MLCAKCGYEASNDAQFCQQCGVPLKELPTSTEPVVINGVTYTPGSDKFAGLYFAPKRGWVKIENGVVNRADGREPLSVGRTIAGWICIAVAGLAALQGFGWVSSYLELEASGNQFSGLLVPMFLGAFVVAAGFGIGGFVLLSPRK